VDSFGSLQQLVLEGNLFKQVPNIQFFEKLALLDIQKNLVSELVGFDNNKKIRSINANGNRIKQLKNFQLVHSKLVELYIANNHIQDIEDLTKNKSLQRLLILDTFGNPFYSPPQTEGEQSSIVQLSLERQ